MSRKALREMLAPWRYREDLPGLILLAFDCLALFALEMVAVFARPLAVKAFASLIAMLVVTRLFILGHDACHGALFTTAWMNQWLGRLAFLPSLTPYSLWEVGHNVMHHSFTNLKGRDWVWTPFTKAEFDQLSASRRLRERLYRSVIGHGFYYAIELWWKRMVVPDASHMPAKRPILRKDLAFVLTFPFVHMAAIALLAVLTGHNPWTAVFFAVILPFCGWLEIGGLVVYQQHTHPAIAWFDKREEWNINQVQVTGTTHILFPGPLNALLHNVMEHTAHHVDAGVPLHNLPRAQAKLEDAFPGVIRVQPWSFDFFHHCLRTCQLYDYDNHRWLSFEGEVTSVVPAIRRLSQTVAQ